MHTTLFAIKIAAYYKLLLSYNFVIINHVEPVGSKAPTFSTEYKSFTFEKVVGQSFGLLCQAQAYPVPLIRLVYVVYISNLSLRLYHHITKKLLHFIIV